MLMHVSAYYDHIWSLHQKEAQATQAAYKPSFSLELIYLIFIVGGFNFRVYFLFGSNKLRLINLISTQGINMQIPRLNELKIVAVRINLCLNRF